MKVKMLSTKQINNYLKNLDPEALRQIAAQLIQNPESREFIENCILEFEKFYKYPLGKKWKG